MVWRDKLGGWKNHVLNCCLGSDAKKNLCQGKWFDGGNYYGAEGAPACDTLVKAFCSMPQNKNHSKCSCINSPIEHASCFDINCIKSGYVPKSMKDKGCNITQFNCTQIVKAQKDGKVILDQGRINQHCGEIANHPNLPPDVPSEVSSSKKKIFILFIIILFSVILIALGISYTIQGGMARNSRYDL